MECVTVFRVTLFFLSLVLSISVDLSQPFVPYSKYESNRTTHAYELWIIYDLLPSLFFFYIISILYACHESPNNCLDVLITRNGEEWPNCTPFTWQFLIQSFIHSDLFRTSHCWMLIQFSCFTFDQCFCKSYRFVVFCLKYGANMFRLNLNNCFELKLTFQMNVNNTHYNLFILKSTQSECCGQGFIDFFCLCNNSNFVCCYVVKNRFKWCEVQYKNSLILCVK